MKIFPAIDLFDGKAVRLFKGDYAQMTVYNESPLSQAKEFEKCGAEFLHMVDLEGAKSGETPNLNVIKEICEKTNLFIELGGGIRSMEVAEKYLSIGVDRVILGTAAVTDEKFLFEAAEKFGEKLAVGVDIKDGFVSIKGWTEKSEYTLDAFCEKLEKIGIKTVICTDISKDGAMKGANLELYKELSEKYTMNFIASGGVSSLEDVRALSEMKLYGAIIGKAYYTGAIDLKEAIEVAK
ncbi:MAG: 1-(5-phosphoribosyl)-5-[Clostridia bacterium]|nr:1-(5-phosphoribosyl)-5-[(5-phosphoribosylamino)methylideneamino]imidazole-4-carboxamide isomerase [Clostridia bacterium]